MADQIGSINLGGSSSGGGATVSGYINQGCGISAGIISTGRIIFGAANSTYDMNSFISASAIIVAKKTGLHIVTISMFSAGSSTSNNFSCYAMQNATVATVNTQLLWQIAQGQGGGAAAITASKIFNMTANDYLAFQTGGTAGSTFTDTVIRFAELGVTTG